MGNGVDSLFQLPIPKNGDVKKLLYTRLGFNN